MVVFGQNSKTILRFQEIKEGDLISTIKGAQLPSGSPDVVQALETTKELFFLPGGGARPDARKIIVVMIDRRTVNTLGEIENMAMEYEEGKVKFVTVVIGNDTDPDELVPLTPDKDKGDVVKTDKDSNPKVVAKKIWLVMAAGTVVFIRF